MNRWYRLTLVTLVLAGTVGCDQATKQLAISGLRGAPGQSFLGGLFRLTYAENPGAFLSLFGGLPRIAQFWLLTAGVGVLLFGMLAYLMASGRPGRLHFVALALCVGGGLSNWFDRLTNDGRVVDFMILGVGPVRTGVFNVADIAIMLGIGLFLLGSPAPRRPASAGTGPRRRAAR
ncbi:signal peptidase II [Myxococcus sp. RHSTA-1-4]|uniref:signal peptidase II n=1 Tax=Myxococcus sp. RHSTA-1-4 TaxID=2874601 RepID=UPI001CBBC67C|nr:signal peptidase II [Myxococcus sp. RHSTA-1-4]